jgi:hypothetical protein
MDHKTVPTLTFAQLKALILQIDPRSIDYPSEIAKVNAQLNFSYDCEIISLHEWRTLLRDIKDFRSDSIRPDLR